MEARIVVFVGLLCLVNYCGASVYKVGDTAGWTIIGNINYTSWSSGKKFHVGDVIHFEYNKDYHNVMEVTKTDYKQCNASSPLVVFKTGNDSIKITHVGHHFFICGVPGHCAIGQKVDIRVVKTGHSSAGTHTGTSPPSSPTGTDTSTSGENGTGISGTGTGTVGAPPKASGTASFVAGLGFVVLGSLVTLVMV